MDDHISKLSIRRQRWLALLFRIGIVGMIMLWGVAFASDDDDQVGVPDPGLLCISNCASCPVICSPPPPPKQSYAPISSPPQTHHSPPPPPSPPQYYYHSPPHSPALPPPTQTSEPPSGSSSSWANPPPPPFKYTNYMPPGQGPPAPGQHDYPYPYYYFYASGSSFLSCHASILLVILFYSLLSFFC